MITLHLFFLSWNSPSLSSQISVPFPPLFSYPSAISYLVSQYHSWTERFKTEYSISGVALAVMNRGGIK